MLNHEVNSDAGPTARWSEGPARDAAETPSKRRLFAMSDGVETKTIELSEAASSRMPDYDGGFVEMIMAITGFDPFDQPGRRPPSDG